MPKQSSWYNQAATVIRRRMAEAAAQGLDAAATRRHVDAGYPFGPRANHPYKMWLKARKALLEPAAAEPVSAETALLTAWNRNEPIPGGDASDVFFQHLARIAEEPQC